MKWGMGTILIAGLSFMFGLFLPWWSVAIVAFLVSWFMGQSPLKSFASAFAAVSLFWGIMATVMSMLNGHLLADKISLLLFKIKNPALLISVTSFIGATVAGFAALTAAQLRSLFIRHNG
jgi:hypothetical protein